MILLVSGCTSQPVCNDPYIVHGTGCCLDQNSNSLCDQDEGIEQTCVPEWQCSEWSNCSVRGSHIRVCTDANECGATESMPEISRNCTPTGDLLVEYCESLGDYIIEDAILDRPSKTLSFRIVNDESTGINFNVRLSVFPIKTLRPDDDLYAAGNSESEFTVDVDAEVISNLDTITMYPENCERSTYIHYGNAIRTIQLQHLTIFLIRSCMILIDF